MTFDTTIKMRETAEAVDVFCEIRHPMTDNQFLTRVEFRVNRERRAELLLGHHVVTNPVLGTRLDKLEPGDRVEVLWQDNRGIRGQQSLVYRT